MTAYDTAALKAAIHTENGEPEVSATWVAENRGRVRLVDVREPHELTGPLGKVEGAENVPLLALLSQPVADPSVPLVLLCRSGRRSALAARELRGRGYATVASVEGGMLAWNSQVLDKHDIVLEEKHANATNLAAATYHTNGIPEVSAQWVHENLGRFRLVDVREPNELRNNGAVPQAVNIPLQQFMQRAAQGELERDMPLVVMCQSGGRSGRVTNALVGAGFSNVASMEGGMFGWRARGFAYA
ncbi:MAG: rhodanese-like domain-containing protein [Alphaproteobacteria bacterium]|nr:rhodanese-like domain-containing protein [Alphaproteobacteria bacterium]